MIRDAPLKRVAVVDLHTTGEKSIALSQAERQNLDALSSSASRMGLPVHVVEALAEKMIKRMAFFSERLLPVEKISSGKKTLLSFQKGSKKMPTENSHIELADALEPSFSEDEENLLLLGGRSLLLCIPSVAAYVPRILEKRGKKVRVAVPLDASNVSSFYDPTDPEEGRGMLRCAFRKMVRAGAVPFLLKSPQMDPLVREFCRQEYREVTGEEIPEVDQLADLLDPETVLPLLRGHGEAVAGLRSRLLRRFPLGEVR